MSTILIIDDDKSLCVSLAETITALGHSALYAHTLAEGLRKSMDAMPDVIFLDVGLPDGDGLAAIPALRAARSEPEVIIFTGASDPDAAELALRSGAWDYIQKPTSLSTFALPLWRALEYRAERQRCQSVTVLKREGIIGESARIHESLSRLAHAAGTDSAVLLTGETGTGKELFAIAIHANSTRAAGRFVVVDCAALPESLVDSLLFGHEKGAYTGADRHTEGLILQAHRGTLFLDEIGELPLSTQKSFLRVLQERRFRPVGAAREVTSDFRLVAATNRDLDSLVKQGSFRDDLLFRLRSFHLALPPLRERRADIRLLIRFHLDRICQRQGGAIRGVSAEFVNACELYDWPGNVRELAQAVEHSVTAAGDEQVLQLHHLPLAVRVCTIRSSITLPRKTGPAAREPGAEFQKFRSFRTRAVNTAEWEYLADLMNRAERDIGKACVMSGLSRPRLYALLSKHKINPRGLAK